MNELKFVLFGESVLSDYIDVILPNVWDELATVDRFDDAGIIALSAELDGEVVGAAIARVLEDDSVQVFSLYVVPEHRRKKVGTALLDAVVSLTRRILTHLESTEISVVETIDYTLEDEEYAAFGAFLKSVGFQVFDEQAPLFLLDGQDAKALATKASDVHIMSELNEDAREEVEGFLDSMGLPTDASLCGFVGSAENPSAIAFAIPSGDNDYSITSISTDADEASYRRLLCGMIAAVAQKEPEFSIMADGTRNPFPEVWAALSEKMTSYQRCVAHRLIQFVAEGA